MSSPAISEYVTAVLGRYDQVPGRKGKSKILDEICATTGIHRKHALRLLRKARLGMPRKAGKNRRGRRPCYDSPDLLKALRTIWKAGNFPCSSRLEAMLPVWLPHFETRYGPLDEEVRTRLLAVSSTTMDRLLKRARTKLTLHGRCTTKPGTLLRNKIPICTGQWEEHRIGFIEADTVAHCGDTTAGQFVSTLDCVDIASGWSEQRAVWGKNDTVVVGQMREIEKAFPFTIKGFDSDNGCEFLNHKLFRYFVDRKKPVIFTRSRAYRKNDNAHVEQKNWTHVRQWVGYDRLEHQELVEALNDLYENEWRLYHNFFNPSAKLLSKERVGSKTKKKYDKPKTPYQRLMESDELSDYTKTKLTEIYENTDPFVLLDHMKKKLRKVFKLSAKLKLDDQRRADSVTPNLGATNTPEPPLGNL